MRSLAFAALALIGLSGPVLAEPTFPPGSRIGLEPPKDMVLSKRFSGFENQGKVASISLSEMPAEAYPQLSASLSDDNLRRQGFTVTKREEVKLGGKAGFLITGTQSAGEVTLGKWVLGLSDPTMTALVVAQGSGYDPKAMEQALKTVALRAPLPIKDQLASLAFKLGDTGGFRAVKVASGNSLLMTEGPNDTFKVTEQPLLVLATSVSPAPPAGDTRERFARAILAGNPNLKDLQVERAQSFRQAGQDWHEIVARAVDGPTNQPIVVVQTIRFGPTNYLRLIGIARADQRDTYLPRFRKVIDTVSME